MEGQFHYCLELHEEGPSNFKGYDNPRARSILYLDYKNYLKTWHINVYSP